MSFRQHERTCQLDWKRSTNALSEQARRPGVYSGTREQERTPDEMFLAEEYAHENLFPWIRLPALRLFEAKDIDWHEGTTPRRPSNYLLDSMVSCVNCLFPFAFDSHALATLFRPIVPDAVDAVVIEDGLFLTHEWLGAENYLRETSPGRKRGAKGTSIDAFCVLVRGDGRRVALLIEWKYTERNKDERKHGNHYRELLESSTGPIDVRACGGAESLFYEPYYQLARQRLLAAKMVEAREFGISRALNVLIVPAGNTDYLRGGRSPRIAELFPGKRIDEAFPALLRTPEDFIVTSYAKLASAFQAEGSSTIAPVFEEIISRYCERRPG